MEASFPIWLVLDMERVDTGDDAEPMIAAAFTEFKDALAVRKLLEARAHPAARLGYVFHFQLRELTVYTHALTAEDVARGVHDEIRAHLMACADEESCEDRGVREP